MASKVDEKTRTHALARMPQWQYDAARDAIARHYVFADFMQAWGFMAEMAMWSEKHNHHPEWRNVYNQLDVALTTHDAGGLTQLDLDWAARAERVFALRVPPDGA